MAAGPPTVGYTRGDEGFPLTALSSSHVSAPLPEKPAILGSTLLAFRGALGVGGSPPMAELLSPSLPAELLSPSLLAELLSPSLLGLIARAWEGESSGE